MGLVPRRLAGNRAFWALVASPAVLAFLWLSSGCSLLFTPPTKNAQRCRCTCTLPQRDTLFRIQAGADDGREASDGTVFLGGDALPFGRHMIGLRFPDLEIPRGAAITSAHIQFTASSSNASDSDVLIHVIRSNDPFVNEGENLSDRIPVPPLGVPAPLTIPWAIAPWSSDDAGPAQRTPDLKDLVAREVRDDPWRAGDSLVVLFEIPADTGVRFAHSFEGVEGDPQRVAILEVKFSAEVEQRLSVCMPPDLNPNLAPGGVQNPNPAPIDEVINYCEARLANTLSGIASRCFDMTHCRCELVSQPKEQTFSHDACDDDCIARVISGDCVELDPQSDLEAATHAPGGEPVCLAESNPDDPTPTALTRGIFGRRSECFALGTARVSIEGAGSDTRPAHSSVAITGGPCPGASCSIGLAHLSVANEDFRFGGLLGFFEKRIEDVVASGASTPRSAVLDAAGAGVLPSGALLSTVYGRGSGDDEDPEEASFEVSNPEPFDVTVDWVTGACSIEGSLAATLEDGEDTREVTVELDLAGLLLNRPPTAVAAANGAFECTSPAGAEVRLDGSASSDPDDNLVERSWRLGGRMGPEVASGEQATAFQALGSEVYVHRVFDRFGQIDEDFVEVVVEDTTPPEIACNAPPTITPSDAPIAFTATASDACDPEIAAEVTAIECFELKKGGRQVDKSHSCVVVVDGDTLWILDSGGVNTQIRWDVRAVDGSGNAAAQSCGVEVVRPS